MGIPIKDLSNMKFGRLTVLKIDKAVDKRVFWLCQCECGNIKSVAGHCLKCGDTLSCGCLQRENASKKNKKHGLSGTSIYKQWAGIKRRCFNPAFKQFNDYGGRGITMCDEWKNSFISFYEWATKNGHKEGLTIDRINNDGNYEPNNCKWASQKEQCANRRTNRIYTVDGVTDILYNLCKKYSMHMDTVINRMKKGLAIEDALKAPLHPGKVYP
jgi:hypothetical protein